MSRSTASRRLVRKAGRLVRLGDSVSGAMGVMDGDGGAVGGGVVGAVAFVSDLMVGATRLRCERCGDVSGMDLRRGRGGMNSTVFVFFSMGTVFMIAGSLWRRNVINRAPSAAESLSSSKLVLAHRKDTDLWSTRRGLASFANVPLVRWQRKERERCMTRGVVASSSVEGWAVGCSLEVGPRVVGGVGADEIAPSSQAGLQP